MHTAGAHTSIKVSGSDLVVLYYLAVSVVKLSASLRGGLLSLLHPLP